MAAATILCLASPLSAAATAESLSSFPLSSRKRHLSNPFLSPTPVLLSPSSLTCPVPAPKLQFRPHYDFRAAAFPGGGTLLHDTAAAAAVMAGAYSLVATFDNLTRRSIIEQSLSRKLVHILSGLLFMASWPIFSTSAEARYFASIVPLINCLRLLVHGLSLAPDEALIKSVTREGNPEELLKGPLYYVLILILCAVVFWRESPVGVVSLAMMCGGDGVADIIGRRYGSLKLPHNSQKSWAGSISMFVSGFLISTGMLYYFSVLGFMHLDWVWTIERVVLVSLVATLTESLPTTGTNHWQKLKHHLYDK